MKKIIIIILTTFLISCGDARVMTLVELPKGWTDEHGQEFIEKMDLRKLQYIVYKKFPEAITNQVTFNIMPLVFSPVGDEKNYKYEIRAISNKSWGKSKEFEKFIANYIKELLVEPEKMPPMVFVKVPQGHSIQSAQQLLQSLNMQELRERLSKAIPGIEKTPMLTKIIPVEVKPDDLNFHVIVVANFQHDFEYKVEQHIADFIRESLKTT
ncbi:hypothetical protein [Shewanella sp. 6_MG-2023]|uniref:hypothetical protein n=1 Tax=Shewanella sp. 6_MG-2023 TaxID=3062660 RepID=UPI0026E41CE2|nr:hypothetical protein [Shewanella sp. 6_MG-2023]MDO6621214.1 hypothetical protein [Shewanella sp. 6_MG-2023]